MKKDSRSKRLMGGLLFAAYILVLLYFTIFSESLGRRGMPEDALRYNLVPFTEIRRFWVYREQLGLWACFMNIFGNIIAFIPCGYLLPSMSEHRRTLGCNLLAGFAVSLMIECTQLVFRVGSFDVDDLMLNTTGAVLGFIIWSAVHIYADLKIRERTVMIREIKLEE